MKFEVQGSRELPPFVNKHGNTMYPFVLHGLLDGQVEPNVQMNFVKPENCPQRGQVIDIDITEVNSYGKKAKKSALQTAQNPSYDTKPMAKVSDVQTNTPNFVGDPRQDSIEWQSARRDAVEFMGLRYAALKDAGLMKHMQMLEFVTEENVKKITIAFMNRTTPAQSAAKAVFE